MTIITFKILTMIIITFNNELKIMKGLNRFLVLQNTCKETQKTFGTKI